MASIKLFAGTDIGLRDNNEDNFIVCPDLTKEVWMVPADQQEPIQLGQRGSLIVVADGMGGMNAGEVASGIAIKTVQQMFSPSVLPASATDKPESITAYLKKVIVKADQEVKNRCKTDPSTEGMGSTIVIAWLLGNNVYIGWLGDSRAYSYIPNADIQRLSKDHSFVQQLVDSKILTEEEAMNHPESNVVLRSLGDDTQKAKPDIVVHPVCDGEVIMLCSDGLCGVCTDDTISSIIQQKYDDLPSCKEALTTAALEAGGSDNITVALLRVVKADAQAAKPVKTQSRKKQIWFLLGVILLCAIGYLFSLMRKSVDPKNIDVDKIELKLSADSMTCNDTISFDVSIIPHNADQSYSLECNNKNVVIDTVSRILFMKGNVQGMAQIVAIAMGDSTKRDTVQLKLRKQIVAVETPPSEIIVDFRINHNGPLEHGNKYNYTLSVIPESAAKDGYSIKCSSNAVTIDKNNQTISVSNDLTNNVNCVISVTVKNVTKKIKYQLIGTGSTESHITSSEGKFDEVTPN